ATAPTAPMHRPTRSARSGTKACGTKGNGAREDDTMSTIQRPIKTGGNREYADERAAGFITVKSSEVDADLDTIYSAWNSGNLTWNTSSIPPSAISPTGATTGQLLAYLPGGTVGWASPGGYWADDAADSFLKPSDFWNRGILLASGRGIQWGNPSTGAAG